MKKLLFLSLIILGLSSCAQQHCTNGVPVKMRNLSGLDGCGWVLELNDGSRLEPMNLNTYDVQMVEGKKIFVTYEDFPGASICMVGKMVKITSVCE
jgi:hypothetical protein